MAELQWTKVVPTERGWYWHDELEDGYTPIIVQVIPREGKGLGMKYPSGSKWYPLSAAPGWWYGPLEPPIRETHT